MQKQKIVLIEDEEDIACLIKMQAELSGYTIVNCSDGLNGLEEVHRQKPDLVLLDLMLPGLNGLDVCRRIKNDAALKPIPIIMLSAKGEETDVVLGLELGADDYVTKPFSPRVLFSRINAVLRRLSDEPPVQKKIEFGDIQINFATYLVKKKGKTIQLTLSEFYILQKLILSAGVVLTRNQLLDSMQNDDTFLIDRNIDVHIAALRKKLGPRFDYIETVRGIGYRFQPDAVKKGG